MTKDNVIDLKKPETFTGDPITVDWDVVLGYKFYAFRGDTRREFKPRYI